MFDWLLDKLTSSLNTYLALDAHSAKRLLRLKDHAINMTFLPMNFRFHLFFDGNKIIVLKDHEENSSVTIEGTPFNFIKMRFATHRERFFQEDLKMEGNAEIGQLVLNLFDDVEIDWEDHLSRFIGNVPAVQISQFATQTKAWLKNLNLNLQQNMTEYLQEEKNFLPTREALADFFKDIDDLRADTDRLSAQVSLLKALKDKM